MELLPSGFDESGSEGFASLTPVVSFGLGDDFAVELGPTLRLRLWDAPPGNRARDVSGLVRSQDWDELSDYGQILQHLRIAFDSIPLRFRAGVARQKSLGLGHLIFRYSNQENVDYHPASGAFTLGAGPVRAEVFASDVLAARLLSGELAWDLGRTISSEAQNQGRYFLAVQLARDGGAGGRPFRRDGQGAAAALSPITLLHFDGSAMVMRSRALRLNALGGMGIRLDERADYGFLVGVSLDASVSAVGISLRIEGRKQAGGFRHGFFGPVYELSRFADVGLGANAIGGALLPDSSSVFGELRVGIGAVADVELAVEHFAFGRTDADATASLQLLGQWLIARLRFTAVGVGQDGRFHVNAGLRLRVLPALYLMGSAGTVFFPQVDGALVPGLAASLGAGIDFER